MKRYFIKYEYGFVLLLAVYWSLYFINDKFLPDWPVVNMQGLRVQILAVTVSVVITLFFFFCYDTRERREVTRILIIFMLSQHTFFFLLPALYFCYEWKWSGDVLLVWQFMAFTFGLPLVPVMAFIIPESDYGVRIMARFIYTPEMKAWMQDNYLLQMDKLSVAFNAHFGTTRSSESLNGLRKRLKLRTSRRGCFTPGSIPANKGTRGVMKANRGSFKKGNRPGNTACVGDEALTDDGYIRVKVAEPNRWELKHRLVWEKYRGEIPENGVIRFIDDNRRNCDIDNLMLVTKADNAVMNRWYSGSSPEYRQATLAMAQIKLAITRRQRDTK